MDIKIVSLFCPKFKKSDVEFEDLNDDCLLVIINKLSLKDRLRLRQNSRLKFLVEDSLRYETGLRIGKSHVYFDNCNDSSHESECVEINGKQMYYYKSNYKPIMKTILRFCPNIKSLGIVTEIDLKTVKWLVNQCPYLECLNINNSKISENMSYKRWIKISKLFSNKLIHLSLCSLEGYPSLSQFHLICFLNNQTKLEKLSIDVNQMSISNISTYMGNNIKSLTLNKCYNKELTIKDLRSLNENLRHLTELKVEITGIDIFNRICTELRQLKKIDVLFMRSWVPMDSLSEISQLKSLEHLAIDYFSTGSINFIAINSLPNLLTLEIRKAAFRPILFDDCKRDFPKLEKLILENCTLNCVHQIHNTVCDECKTKVLDSISKLNDLKVLRMNLWPRKDTGFTKSFVWMFTDQSFRSIQELHLQWLPYEYQSFMDNLLVPFINLVKSNPKRVYRLTIDSEFYGYVTKKRVYHNVKYNVILPFIPNNLKIINCYKGFRQMSTRP